MNIPHYHKDHPSILSVQNDNLDTLLASITQPIIIDFWAAWCRPCTQAMPIINSLAEELQGKVKIIKVNLDESQHIAKQYNILSLPTILILDSNKKEIARQVGVPNNLKEIILEILDPCIT